MTRNENLKKRLVIDYSQTINNFTMLVAYPLPHIDDTVNSIAQYRVFCTNHLCSTYHQFKIKDSDKPYTVFLAGNALYHFTQVPFGVTNGVACFQRAMDSIITEDQLQATFPYLDNITICGIDQRVHDVNFIPFLEAASRRQIKYDDCNCVFSTWKYANLGSIIEEGDIRPDPECLSPLQVLPVPEDRKSLR